jgi:organic radical activating enzyme
MKIKVSELFYSIQGEGRYMGVPSIFLRTFGCNFSCQGFGMPQGQISDELTKIDPSAYNDYKSLPLVSTGCDSYASWDVRFKHLSPLFETVDLVSKIESLLPPSGWIDTHLVITGGEPLLGWQRAYPELLRLLVNSGLRELTFETNGTQLLDPVLSYELAEWNWNDVTFSVSPKLSNSGELRADAIKPEVIAQYELHGFTYLKFVIANEEDAAEALEVADIYYEQGFGGPIYFMPVGGVSSVYALNNQRVAELAMKHGVRYSDRLQVPLFKNAWGT